MPTPTPAGPRFALSPLEEARFGVRTVRASDLGADELAPLADFCRENRVQLVIARCPSTAIATAQGLEALGGRLMDTLVYYSFDLSRSRTVAVPARVRPARDGEAEALAAIAEESFRDYRGHYHADPRLDRAACDAVYSSWARRSVLDRAVADAVHACDVDGRLAAFATLRQNTPEEGEGVLFGVAPWAQGRGIYADLIASGVEWCRERGHARMVVSTQVTNLAVQRVWIRHGFEPTASHYTFHVWFA